MENDNALNGANVEVVKPQTEETVVPETVTGVKSEVATETAEVTKEEKPKQSPEENARFAEVRRKAEAEALDKAVRELGKHFKWDESLNSWDSVMEAIKEQEVQKKAEETGADPEFIKDYERLKEANDKYEKERTKQQMYVDFKKEFPEVDFKDVPKEIWAKVADGENLKNLYMEYDYKRILKERAESQKVETINKSNEEASTGSITGKQGSDDGYITQTEFDAKKGDKNWLSSKYDEILKSYKAGRIKSQD